MSYTTETKIENYLMIEIDGSMSSQLTDWISAVEQYIDKYTGRKDGFSVGAATTKYFNGNGEREIVIDDFISLTTVQILESNGEDVEWTLVEGLENDYIAFPYNESPQYRLILTTNAQVGAWFSGEKRIKITAVWGYLSTVPKDIELAATMLVSNIIEKGLRGGTVQAESLGDYSISYANIDATAETMGIKKILDNYRIYKL